jgi:hypothetical protein
MPKICPKEELSGFLIIGPEIKWSAIDHSISGLEIKWTIENGSHFPSSM